MSEEYKSLHQIIDFRMEKLNKLREAGVNPYPHKYAPTHKSQYILNHYDELEGPTVCVAGRIMALRKMGKASFAHVMDSTGRIQIFIRRDDVGEDIYNHFKLLDIGDFAGLGFEYLSLMCLSSSLITFKSSFLDDIIF